MDASTAHRWLFDPRTAHATVLARRPAHCSAVACVVSDSVWSEVVTLLRWADAGLRDDGRLATALRERLAVGCAHLLRRLPGLCAEVGEPYAVVAVPEDDRPGAERVRRAAGRLERLLRTAEPVTLARLATSVDALGAAAVAALAEAWCTAGARPPARPPARPGTRRHESLPSRWT
ncbi:hypothetical protein [Blastococcus sp. SYSU D00820]